MQQVASVTVQEEELPPGVTLEEFNKRLEEVVAAHPGKGTRLSSRVKAREVSYFEAWNSINLLLGNEEDIKQPPSRVVENFYKESFFGDDSLTSSIEKSRITSQSEVLARLLNKENLFISGPAGSGKSTVIKRFVELLEYETNGEIRIGLTASTGMAASLLGGQTIHSWAGLGISTEPFNRKELPKGYWGARERMREADVLIIDEVSMIPLHLFEKLDATLKFARSSSMPFGGVQVVILGDFMQLPPVDRDEEVDCRFAVFSESWKNLELKYCYLDRIHRAKDRKLLYLLNSIAAEKVNEKTVALLESRMVPKEEGRDYTKLYTTNRNVDKENNDSLAKNPNRAKTYYRSGVGDLEEVEKACKKYNIPKSVELKVDAIVMLTRNTETPIGFYPNGSIGRVISMSKSSVKVRFSDGGVTSIDYTIVREEKKVTVKVVNKEGKTEKRTEKDVVAQISYLPLKLGYAITVHKAQGTTVDSVQADLSNCFTPGLGYVALSRVRSLDDLVLLGYDDRTLKVSPISSKVTKIVVKKAKRDREDFVQDLALYENLVTNREARALKWGK